MFTLAIVAFPLVDYGLGIFCSNFDRRCGVPLLHKMCLILLPGGRGTLPGVGGTFLSFCTKLQCPDGVDFVQVRVVLS